MKNIFYLIITCFLIYSCGSTTTVTPKKFVIEAFLFAGEPVDDIYIKSTFPISEVEDISEPISNATVILTKNNINYELIPSDSAGYYHYPDSNLTVEVGDVFYLEVNHDNVTATAQTTVPTPTTGLTLAPDTVSFPFTSFPPSDSARNIIAGLSMTATWDNPNQEYFYMVVELIDEVNPIFPSAIAEFLERFRYVSEPTNNNSLTLAGVGLTSLGTHKAKVYHINQEYVDLFLNQEQDSRDLNEPPTNIDGALGIFSAFNSQEAYFEVDRR